MLKLAIQTLSKSVYNLFMFGATKITASLIKAILEVLQTRWAKFEARHERLLDEFSAEFKTHEYLIDDFPRPPTYSSAPDYRTWRSR
ncbi:hypothetical protein ALC56_09839 [Trachymyrmex septentrionalis]|uniref:Uncharacterized protein n=1 Tax=Trachymyrmex septentrionalis TaxID=34720 RepID=A0A151JUL1_9HYME|nr:hypothetical protein ALC56_09839 [Trachymyrmex septentrionalis]